MATIKDELEQIVENKNASILGDELPHKLQIAAAALLVYAAKADGTFSEDELDTVMRALAKEFKHPDHYSAEMIEVATYLHDNNKRIADFTQLLNQSLVKEQRQHLLDLVIKVVRADGRVSVAESILAGNLARDLGLKSS